MSQSILGIDVAKNKFDVILIQNEMPLHAIFENKPAGFHALAAWLADHHAEHTHTCMEATGYYDLALADFLYHAGHLVSVVNPVRVKAFAKSQLIRNKTDKSDAAVIADFCRKHCPAPWTPPTAAWRKLKSMTHHLEDLKAMRQQERNRLQASGVSDVIQEFLRQHIDFLTGQIKDLEREIQNHVKRDPLLKWQTDLLVSIPGISTLTAAKLLAEIRSVDSFDSPGQLVAYAGLNPQHHSSGSSVRRRTRISKTGNAVLRKALYFPAIVAKQHNPLIHAFYQRLLQRGLAPKAAIIAAMRKLLHLVYGILKSGRPFDPNFAANSIPPA